MKKPGVIRISAGEFRNRRLVFAPGTRPSSSRLREAVFDVLGARMRIEGARFLDLYAGSGAVGIEALSRGASRAVFVESDPEALRALRANLAKLGCLPRAEVVPVPVARARLSGDFAAAFADPPFSAGLLEEAARSLAAALVPNGWGLLQAPRGAPPPATEGLSLVRTYRHGASELFLFRRAE